MKVKKVIAWRSDDDCIWTTEEEAIDQNIDQCIERCDITNNMTYTDIKLSIRKWLKNHKSSVRYVLANIDKVNE